MSRRRTSRRLAIAIAALGVVMIGSLTACGGDAASGYSAEDMATGDTVELASLRGKPVLLVSWATWCKECDEELAGLQEFASSDLAQGIEVVAVNLDAASVESEIDAKIAKHSLTTELWRDRRNGFKREFGALGVPTTVLVDAEGTVVETFPGAIDFDDTDLLAALERVQDPT